MPAHLRDRDSYPFWVVCVAIGIILFAAYRLYRHHLPDPAEVERENKRPVAGVGAATGADWSEGKGDVRVEDGEDGETPRGWRWVEGQR